MRYTPDILAKALYLTVKKLPENETRSAVTRFAAFVRGRLGQGMLVKVMERLPATIRKIEGIEEVVIESARELDDELVKDILKTSGLDAASAEVTRKIEPELIGGVKIRRRDSVLDATVKGRTDRLRALTSAPLADLPNN